MRLKLRPFNCEKKLRIFSVCSGVGGMEISLDRNRFVIVGHSEVDKHCNAVLRYRFPGVKNYGDITKVNKSELPDFDILIGGTPCSDLSISGKRKGIFGRRSGLFMDFVGVLQEKRPDYFIWENVKGAINSNNGWDFAYVQTELAKSGYDFRWEIFNGRDYGVPQNRERVFIIGHLTGSGRSKIFCESKRCSESSKDEGRRCRISVNDNREGKVMPDTFLMAYSKSTRDYTIDHRAKLNIEANTLNTGDGCRSQSTANYITYKFGDDWRVRKITPLEAERLMGWEDDWTKIGMKGDGTKYNIPESSRYAMCGNGVISNKVKCILERLV